MTAQVAADLRAAAEVLRRDGWQQQGVGETTTPKCALGALNYIASCGQGTGDDELDETERERSEAAALIVAGLVHQAVWSWNDAPGRTADEVIAALEAAADAAERQP